MSEMWKWKPWFAWYPVKTDKGYRWLCFVQRRNQWMVKEDVVHESYIGYEYK